MGLCISKSKLYTRNELLYANRMAEKYGISQRRYASFLKSSEYELVMLNFDSLIREEVDDSYINAWNNWKRLQSWDKKYSDLDRPLLVFLSNMPTGLNGSHYLCRIPKKHDESQRESLICFYTMLNLPKEGYDSLEKYINHLLDTVYYEDLVAEIKGDYDPNDWELSQTLPIKWSRMIRDIRNSGLKDISHLKLIEQFCLMQQNIVYDTLNNKIII
jgi:hypothetical protein